jgi:hypothetical protein
MPLDARDGYAAQFEAFKQDLRMGAQSNRRAAQPIAEITPPN